MLDLVYFVKIAHYTLFFKNIQVRTEYSISLFAKNMPVLDSRIILKEHEKVPKLAKVRTKYSIFEKAKLFEYSKWGVR